MKSLKFLHPSKLILYSRYHFKYANQNNQQKNQNEKIQNSKRRLALESIQIKKIIDKTQNTRGNFNPLLSYVLIYYKFFFASIVSICIALFGFIIFKRSGIYIDPLTNKKKIVLVSSSSEKQFNQCLLQMVKQQLNSGQLKSNEKLQKLEGLLLQKTGRKYEILQGQSNDFLIVVLPSSIIISKNFFLSKHITNDHIQSCLLLLQRLFSRRTHILELSLSNSFIFFDPKQNNLTFELQLLMIYSKCYTKQDIQFALAELQKDGISAQKIATDVRQLLSLTKKGASCFAITKRLNIDNFQV